MLSSSLLSWIVAILLLGTSIATLSQYSSLSSPLITVPTAQKTINFHTPVLSSGYSLPGHITQNLVLSPDMGIILIHSMVTIEKGASVIIQPGTTIAVDEYGGIDVKGSISAIGTHDKPITFITNEQHELNRHWAGILLESSGSAHIANTIFHHASPPISCAPGSTHTLEAITSLFDTTNSTTTLCQVTQNGVK